MIWNRSRIIRFAIISCLSADAVRPAFALGAAYPAARLASFSPSLFQTQAVVPEVIHAHQEILPSRPGAAVRHAEAALITTSIDAFPTPTSVLRLTLFSRRETELLKSAIHKNNRLRWTAGSQTMGARLDADSVGNGISVSEFVYVFPAIEQGSSLRALTAERPSLLAKDGALGFITLDRYTAEDGVPVLLINSIQPVDGYRRLVKRNKNIARRLALWREESVNRLGEIAAELGYRVVGISAETRQRIHPDLHPYEVSSNYRYDPAHWHANEFRMPDDFTPSDPPARLFAYRDAPSAPEMAGETPVETLNARVEELSLAAPLSLPDARRIRGLEVLNSARKMPGSRTISNLPELWRKKPTGYRVWVSRVDEEISSFVMLTLSKDGSSARVLDNSMLGIKSEKAPSPLLSQVIQTITSTSPDIKEIRSAINGHLLWPIPPAAQTLLKALQLDQLDTLPLLHAGRAAYRRVRWPARADRAKSPATGPEALQFELANTRVIAEELQAPDFDLTELDVVYNDEGHAIAIFPVLPMKLVKRIERHYEKRDRDAIKALRLRYLELSDYYFQPHISDPHLHRHWQDFLAQKQQDQDTMTAYRRAMYGDWEEDRYHPFKPLGGKAAPYAILQIYPKGNAYVRAIQPIEVDLNVPDIADAIERLRAFHQSSEMYSFPYAHFPTVYPASLESLGEVDRTYHESLLNTLTINPEDDVLVIGPGDGPDVLAASLKTRKPIDAVGINPLEVAGTAAAAAASGIPARVVVGDVFTAPDGSPVFGGKSYDVILYNMSNLLKAKPSPHGPNTLKDYWDTYDHGPMLERFARELPGRLTENGRALVWNRGKESRIRQAFEAAGLIVEKLGADVYMLTRKPPLSDSHHRPPLSVFEVLGHDTHHVGGLERWVDDFTRALSAHASITIRLIYGSRDEDRALVPLRDPNRVTEVPVALPSRKPFLSHIPITYWNYLTVLRRLFLDEKSQGRAVIFHLHTPYSLPLLLALRTVEWLYAVPLVLTFHQVDDAVRRNPLIQQVAAQILPFLAIGTTITGVSASTVKRFYTRPALVHSGVDLDFYRPSLGQGDRFRRKYASFGLSPDATLVFDPSRILPDKGQQDLVAVAEGLRRAGMKAQIVLMGPVLDEPYRERLFQDVNTKGLQNYICVLPPGTREDIRDGYAASALIISPTRREALGNVFLEGAAMGRPSVSYGVDGVPDAIEDGVTGLLAPALDVETLGRFTLALLENPDQRNKLGRAARLRVVKNYNWSSHITSWVELFWNLVGTTALVMPDRFSIQAEGAQTLERAYWEGAWRAAALTAKPRQKRSQSPRENKKLLRAA